MKINSKKLELAMANACMLTKELSNRTGLNYSTITRTSKGENVNPATVGKIAFALGVSVQSLIEQEAATSNQ